MRREYCRSTAEAHTIAELVLYARELLDIIAEEIIDQPKSTVADARAVLAQLRSRLESPERDIMPALTGASPLELAHSNRPIPYGSGSTSESLNEAIMRSNCS